ncbi:hypothetical protein ABK040_015182 [Willaertia magna]
MIRSIISAIFRTIIFTITLTVLTYYIYSNFFVGKPQVFPDIYDIKPLKQPSIRNYNFHYETIKTNNVNLNVIQMGNLERSNKLILFVHGFPQTAANSWYSQLRYFEQLNFTINNNANENHEYFIMAPDMRGYNQSEKPDVNNINNYDIGELVMDLKGLVDHYYIHLKKQQKSGKVIIISHDWGAVISWYFAINLPEYVEKLVILNVPHPHAMQNFRGEVLLRQLKKSWYVFYFQLGFGIPEGYFSKDNYKRFMNMFSFYIKEGYLSVEDVELVRKAYKEENALTAMMNYYRALVTGKALAGIRKLIGLPEQRRYPSISEKLSSNNLEDVQVKVPTLILWGKEDLALEELGADISYEKYIHPIVKDKSKLLKVDATHFLTFDAAETVNQALVDYLKQ